jgi:Na+/H+-dicarboxylate symporter
MTAEQENTDDLIVGLVASFLVPIVGVILGAMVARRGDSKGLVLLGWSLLTTFGVIAVIAAGA